MSNQLQADRSPIIGTGQSDTLDGTYEPDLVIGLAGDDVITTAGGEDEIHGDFIGQNLLDGTETATSFAQYGDTGAWTVQDEGGGHASMSQSVTTVAGATYEIRFELAANYGANALSGAVEVLWNGEVISSFDTNSAVFQDQIVAFQGTGGPGELTFRSVESSVSEGPEILTDLPVFYYETTKEIGGTDVTVKAIAEGQSHIYQVLNGKLHLFDPVSETYTPAGADATVVVNAIGFNQEDNLIYGIAVRDGVDARGNAVSQTDLMMYDAGGDAYRIGATPYRSWTADIDDAGNLWAFHSSMDRVTRIDLDQFDENGSPVSETFKFPADLVTDKVWDVGFDAASNSFYGVVKPTAEGQPAKLFQIDISAVADGGEPTFSTTPITATLIDGVLRDGVPNMTFGAFVVDGEGNLYAGGNGGDHDMNDSTGTSGGIYKVITDADTGTITLELVADAPKSYSNDGAVDPRTMDPFTPKDQYANVLIRSPEVVQTPDPDQSYDDQIHSGAHSDTVYGGFGEDTIIGAGRGDVLNGGAENDAIYGGAGPDSTSSVVSVYDEDGVRYDPFGNVLPEDDDLIYGGDGDDALYGSAGHDSLHGGAGNDTLDGGTGFDNLFGDAGDDTLSGGNERDFLSGGDGNDVLNGGRGDDTLFGDAGADLLQGGSDQDTLSGGDGADTLEGGSGDDSLSGDRGADELIGGSGSDTLSGGDGQDTLKGGSGDDTLAGDKGNDRLDGGQGDDVVSGGAGNDYVKGGSGADTLSGGDGKDKLIGYVGDDVLDGGAGADRLYLGAGSDLATGGSGSDRFIFRADDMDGGTDQITDFRNAGSEQDRLDVRQLSLLSDAMTADLWIATFVSQEQDNGVTVDFGSCTVRFDARDDGSENALYLEVCDGFLF